jgi:hypothetical protein
MARRKNTGEGFIVELIHVGSFVKVTAIDPETGREVSIVGDPKKSQKELEDTAVKKMIYVLDKEAKERKKKQQNKKGTDFKI